MNLGNSEIRILGHLITANGIKLDPSKRQAILDWPLPKSGAELASFLGLGTFLRDHIRHYSDLTSSLETLKKQTNIEWTEATTTAFNTLKRAFHTAPFLRFPDFNKRFVIACDASWTGVGGVLYQPDDDDNTITGDNIVAICSKKLTKTQQRYPVYKKELWAMVYCLRKFHTYIWGRKDVTVITDHKPLIHILNQQNLSAALQQWLDIILHYDLTIKYRPGLLHVIPDALSRMYSSAYHDNKAIWGTHDNLRIIETSAEDLSPSDFWCQQSITEAAPPKVVKKRHVTPETGEGSRAKISSIQATDQMEIEVELNQEWTYEYSDETHYAFDQSNDVSPPFEEDDENDFDNAIDASPLTEAATVPHLAALEMKRNANYNLPMLANAPDLESEEDDKENYRARDVEADLHPDQPLTMTTAEQDRLLMAQEKRRRRIPPEDQRKKLIDDEHALGHTGTTNIYRQLMRKGWWWPKMISEITDEVKSCKTCAQYTIVKSGYHPFKSVEASRPGEHWMIDLISVPQDKHGKTLCLVVIDVFTGFIILRPLLNKEAETIARKLFKIFYLFGPPKILQSDRGKEFINDILRAYLRIEGVEHRTITPYHPHADGKVENAIGSVKDILYKTLQGVYEHWPLFLPFVQCMYNHRISELTGSSPFSLMFARAMNEFTDYSSIVPTSKIDMSDIKSWKDHQEKVLSLVYPAIELRSRKIHQQYQDKLRALRNQVVLEEIPRGSKVMIVNPDFLKKEHMRPTHIPKYVGPYFIVRRNVHGPYIVKDETGEEYHRAVPIDQMKILYKYPHKYTKLKDDESKFYVDYIVDEKEDDEGKPLYQVKWKGYPIDQSTWESAESFDDVETLYRWERVKASRNQVKKRKGQSSAMRLAPIIITSSMSSDYGEHLQTSCLD